MKNLTKSKKSLRTQILLVKSGRYFGGTLSGRQAVTVSKANALTMTPESAEQHKCLLNSWGYSTTIESI
jgi:hypothetical protein